MNGLDLKIKEISKRIKDLREIAGILEEEMANKTGVSVQEYIACENGDSDLNFAFIYRCASALGVNVTDIIEGYSPKLSSYTVTRAGAGQKVSQAHKMTYYNMAYAFQNRIAEPLFVKCEYSKEAQDKEIELTTHTGQECDIVIEGSLMVQIGDHKEVLTAGDSIYYNSSTPHGMIAVGGKDCSFYAIVLNPTGEPIPELTKAKPLIEKTIKKRDEKDRIYKKFIDVVENENGTPTSIKFKNTDSFNFAYDLVDALAEKEPNKLAMMYVAKDLSDKRFTFSDMKKESNRVANYLTSLGIKKGDRVMLVLKRHYQFWFSMLALNKIGAIAIPAPNQLQEHDFEYRFKAAGIKAIICTADGDVANQVDIGSKNCPELEIKLIVNGKK
ncbi:MAG: AMP-binding protein, partial [Clostridia bacterium]|nr:AMP-binding protein [Clostridia bacterium]